MPKKPKFKPEIIRIALNPEQAVLGCNCYNTSAQYPVSTAKWSPLVDQNACYNLAAKTIFQGKACSRSGTVGDTGDVAIKTARS